MDEIRSTQNSNFAIILRNRKIKINLLVNVSIDLFMFKVGQFTCLSCTQLQTI